MTQPHHTPPLPQGLAFIGDPHLAGRAPGFRRDDYARTALRKLQWCLHTATQHNLLPVLLGDLFHWPRENPNWLLSELLTTLPPHTPCVIGNHDIRENVISPHDSITLLHRAQNLHILDTHSDGPLHITLHNSTHITLAGTSWGQPLPTTFTPPPNTPHHNLTVWITHHDIAFPNLTFPDALPPFEIPGVDFVINGHIHLPQPPTQRGQTTWMNPGNIVRLARDESTQKHMPSMLFFRPQRDAKPIFETHIIPHEAFDDVFYEKQPGLPIPPDEDPFNILGRPSAFVLGLEELAAQKTDAGAGLTHFLDQNLPQLQPNTQRAIVDLALHVLPQDHPWRKRHDP